MFYIITISSNYDCRMFDLLTDLPILLLLGLALFIGVVALVRLLLSPEGGLERRSSCDRRKGGAMPPVPFYDADRELVVEDRREEDDRRRRAFIITSEHKRLS